MLAALVAFLPGPGSLAQTPADAIVQQLRALPPVLPPLVRSDGTVEPIEQRRRELYLQLRRLGTASLPALERGLRDPDVRIRSNVALALSVLASTWFEPSERRLDIEPCLPALIAALWDPNSDVRARAAHAIGEIGPSASSAVPVLVELLKNPDEASRIGACIGLAGIGPAAKEALPALREALADISEDVRRFARRAIAKIE